MNRMGEVGQGESLQDMYRAVPFVTKILVTSTVLSGAAISFNMISPEVLVLDYYFLVNQYQIWRLFTPFVFAGGFSFNFLMHTLVLYENCRNYEMNPMSTGAGGTSADFLWMLFLGMIIFIIIGLFLEIYVLSEAVLFMVMYVFSRRDPNAVRSIFSFRFKGLYLPWIYVGIRLLMGSSIAMPIMGIVVGHLYFFLVEVLPNTHDIDIIKTPQFCINLVSYVTGVTPLPRTPMGAAATQAQAQFANLGGGYNWGRGRHLGRQ